MSKFKVGDTVIRRTGVHLGMRPGDVDVVYAVPSSTRVELTKFILKEYDRGKHDENNLELYNPQLDNLINFMP